MKLTADTPPDGDFVRYLAELERASPLYQALTPSPPAGPDPASPNAADAERPPAPPARQRVGQALQDLAQRPPAPLRAAVAPLLQRLERLERVLAEAGKKR
ncbi:MAG: hypothetical protein JWQ88_535 [Rhodoferax sp.]|nr:hypothetical protein [Rhodoferax sp.]